MNRIVFMFAAFALASPALAQEAVTTEITTVTSGDYIFDLDDTSGSGETYGDYEEASPGEANGPDVSFDL